MGYEDHPVATINYKGAVSYCKWIEALLPNEFEWEIAAKGVNNDSQYTWGDERDESKANVGKEWTIGNKMPTKPVKSYPPNDFGLYDMVGNVSEWTSSSYTGYPGATEAVFHSDKRVRMVVRGGDWNSNWEGARVFFRRNVKPHNRGFFEGALGFRCSMEVE